MVSYINPFNIFQEKLEIQIFLPGLPILKAFQLLLRGQNTHV